MRPYANLAGRVGRDGEAEVLLKGVVGELKALLGPVRPQVPVHGVVHRLPVGAHTRAPGVVPEAAWEDRECDVERQRVGAADSPGTVAYHRSMIAHYHLRRCSSANAPHSGCFSKHTTSGIATPFASAE